MICDSTVGVEEVGIGPDSERLYRYEHGIPDGAALGPVGICEICRVTPEDELGARHVRYLWILAATKHFMGHGWSLENARAYAEKIVPGDLEKDCREYLAAKKRNSADW
jgi:hypothetical protein